MAIPESKFPEPHDLVKWWHTQRIAMPCLTQVAGALLACKPGSGGLECDFGSLGDIVTGKRATLSAGYVEATMMLKINKDYVTTNSSDVVFLGRDEWQKHIPTRPDTTVLTNEFPENVGEGSDMDVDNEDDTDLEDNNSDD